MSVAPVRRMLLRARVAVLTDTGTPVSCWIVFLNAFTPMPGFALSVAFTSGSIQHKRARAFPLEQFPCSKSAWVTSHSSRTDFVARTSAVRAEHTTGGATGTCDGSCFGFGSSAAPEHEYFFCRPPAFPEALYP